MLRTSITLKLVPVSTKIHISQCEFATFFQENLPMTLFRKIMPWHTTNTVGGKFNFFILL